MSLGRKGLGDQERLSERFGMVWKVLFPGGFPQVGTPAAYLGLFFFPDQASGFNLFLGQLDSRVNLELTQLGKHREVFGGERLNYGRYKEGLEPKEDWAFATCVKGRQK